MRMVHGLANADAARLLASRADQPYAGIDDLWRRARVPIASLVRLAEADAFRPAFALSRREVLWAIRALRDEPLPLFAAAAARAQAVIPEIVEPMVTLKPMTAGRDVTEDYNHVGLTLRQHPLSFLRRDLASRKMMTCADAMASRDGRSVRVAGLVLVRQRPGSARGVLFVTIEDETGIANLVIWPKLFEAQRRVVLTAGMLEVDGRIQREGEVVHLIASRLHDLSGALASVGDRDAMPQERGDGIHLAAPGGNAKALRPAAPQPRDVHVQDRSLRAIKVRTRDFR